MADDVPATTLCTWAQFTSGPFADLGRSYEDPEAQLEVLSEATRLCEDAIDRRLVPFVGHVDVLDCYGINPDEYPNQGAATSQQAALGQSYANSLGGDTGVRRVWVREYGVRYPELWTYANVSVQIETTYGGAATATAIDQLPDVDSGALWFSLGTWVPIGSKARVTYSGGYTVAIPASLVRAGKFMTAYVVLREIQPSKVTRDPAALRDDALFALSAYARD